jgi:hypothetical protein
LLQLVDGVGKLADLFFEAGVVLGELVELLFVVLGLLVVLFGDFLFLFFY